MAQSESRPAIAEHDYWPIMNPWLWMTVAIVLAVTAVLWMRLAGGLYEMDPIGNAGRPILVFLAVLSAGSAIAIRLNTQIASYLDLLPFGRKSSLFVMFLLIVLVAAGMLGMLLVGLLSNFDIPISGVALGFLCGLVLPILGSLALICLNGNAKGRPLSKWHEGAALLVFGAVVAHLSGCALYVGAQRPESWDTMRVVLGGISLAAWVGAGLALLPRNARYAVVSTLVILHFGGILCAVLSVNPVPWLIQHVRNRVYRPYLQFMYLENAYQFYAPNPGPSNYFWFRIQYENAKGKRHWRWHKFPDMNAKSGWPNYALPIQHHRRVALCDQMAIPTGVSPPLFVQDLSGKTVSHPIYYWRVVYSPVPTTAILGKPEPVVRRDDVPIIPKHPDRNFTAQYREPSLYAKRLMQSAVRHVSRWKHPEYPDDKVVSVKIYHVIHEWPTPQMINRGIGAEHPGLYYPFYQGEYDTSGKLLDEPKYDDNFNLGPKGDPHLHWLLPILMQDNTEPNDTVVYGWVFKHAGDRNWVMHLKHARDWQTLGELNSKLKWKLPN